MLRILRARVAAWWRTFTGQQFFEGLDRSIPGPPPAPPSSKRLDFTVLEATILPSLRPGDVVVIRVSDATAAQAHPAFQAFAGYAWSRQARVLVLDRASTIDLARVDERCVARIAGAGDVAGTITFGAFRRRA